MLTQIKEVSMEPRQERKQRITEQRRAQILDAALDLFSRVGFAQTTTHDIAHEAGVAEGTIYNYFQSKRDLLVSLASSQILSEVFLGFPERAAEVDFATLLSSLVENRLTLGLDRGDTLAVLFSEIHRDPELRAQFVERVTQPALTLMEARLESGIASGELRPMDVAVVARAIVGTIIGFIFLYRLERGKSPIEGKPHNQLAAELTNLLLLGLKERGIPSD
jgi:AcrR family transcriptional regulator